MNARTTALAALIACRKQGAWADGVLKEYIVRDKLDRRDAALASRLCYGVLQNRMLLDFQIQACLNGSIKKLQPVVLDILRLGMFQILFLDKVPVSAAVNEAVEQGKKYANRSAAGMINGVLRHAAREKDHLPVPESLSIRYSHPEPLVELLKENVGAGQIEALLASHNQAPKTLIQLNPLAGEPKRLMEELQDSGLTLEAHPWLENAFWISGMGNLETLALFREGAFFVQDAAARLAVEASGAAPGMHVLDCCAAPGGKSFSAAMMMNNSGSILSCDLHPHKLQLLDKGAERLHISIMKARLQDATVDVPQWHNAMDVVLADVPCSGLGVIRKKPDSRYKDLSRLTELPAVQLRILETVSSYVKPGGVLLYSTCTILHRENEDVVRQFLGIHSDFAAECFALPQALGGSCPGMITLLPHVHDTDGFFICRMRRKA